jgi:hypothetical protein
MGNISEIYAKEKKFSPEVFNKHSSSLRDTVCVFEYASYPKAMQECYKYDKYEKQDTKASRKAYAEKKKSTIEKKLGKCLKNNEHIAVGVTAVFLAYQDGLSKEDALKCGLLVSIAYENLSDPVTWGHAIESYTKFHRANNIIDKCRKKNIEEGGTRGYVVNILKCNQEVSVEEFWKKIVSAQNSLKPFIAECRAAIEITELPSLNKC